VGVFAIFVVAGGGGGGVVVVGVLLGAGDETDLGIGEDTNLGDGTLGGGVGLEGGGVLTLLLLLFTLGLGEGVVSTRERFVKPCSSVVVEDNRLLSGAGLLAFCPSGVNCLREEALGLGDKVDSWSIGCTVEEEDDNSSHLWSTKSVFTLGIGCLSLQFVLCCQFKL
jgi:coenzyme F420-reducing hydrogenase beta subunit